MKSACGTSALLWRRLRSHFFGRLRTVFKEEKPRLWSFFLFLFRIHLTRPFESRFGCSFIFELANLNNFVLELFVRGKEVADLFQCVSVHVRKVFNVLPTRIARRNGDDLLIGVAAIDHVHDCDWTSANENAWKKRCSRKKYDVKRIPVVPQSLGYEAVVERINLGCVVHTVKRNNSSLLIYLVLILGTTRNFNDDVHLLLGARGNIV